MFDTYLTNSILTNIHATLKPSCSNLRVPDLSRLPLLLTWNYPTRPIPPPCRHSDRTLPLLYYHPEAQGEGHGLGFCHRHHQICERRGGRTSERDSGGEREETSGEGGGIRHTDGCVIVQRMCHCSTVLEKNFGSENS